MSKISDSDKLNLIKNIINEVTLTGHDDSMSRKLRKTIKGKRHLKGDDSRSKPDPSKKPIIQLGRKSNNNKPEKKKLRLESVNERLLESAKFLTENFGKEISDEAISKINDKLLLQSCVNTMLSYHLNGWFEDTVNGNKVISNGKMVANPENWNVVEGLLYYKDGTRPVGYDWIHGLRAKISESINIRLVEERINAKR